MAGNLDALRDKSTVTTGTSMEWPISEATLACRPQYIALGDASRTPSSHKG